jgi:hypothetical protein
VELAPARFDSSVKKQRNTDMEANEVAQRS